MIWFYTNSYLSWFNKFWPEFARYQGTSDLDIYSLPVPELTQKFYVGRTGDARRMNEEYWVPGRYNAVESTQNPGNFF
jgi:hypothetical protein